MRVNKVAGTTTVLLFILLAILGIGNFLTGFGYPLTSYAFWFYIVSGALILFVAWALYKMISDFERLTSRYKTALSELGYRDLEDYNSKRELKRTLDQILDMENKEDGSLLLKEMSTNDLLALRIKFQNIPSLVKLIDSVLKDRGEGTEEV